jgi:predicted TIM-barrel fold metal-dependent hydrolase
MMMRTTLWSCILIVLLVTWPSLPASAQSNGVSPQAGDEEVDALRPPGCSSIVPDLYFVDAHSQMEHRVDEERVISLMDHAGVYRTLLSNHLVRPWESIVAFADRKPDRIVPMVRTKGGGRYTQQLEEQARSDRFRGMAEVLVWHGAEPGMNVPEIRIDLDSSWVTSTLSIARGRGWPYLIHIEFASLTGEAFAGYMHALENLLRQYPDQPFALMHMGQLSPEEVGRLIDAHPNLSFLASHSNPMWTNSGKHWQIVVGRNGIAPGWRSLMVDHPERFLFALDNVFAGAWTPRSYLRQMKLWWCALGGLPPAAAHAIAHGNAERLWKLAPKPAGFHPLPPWLAIGELGPVRGNAEAGVGAGRAEGGEGVASGRGKKGRN